MGGSSCFLYFFLSFGGRLPVLNVLNLYIGYVIRYSSNSIHRLFILFYGGLPSLSSLHTTHIWP